MVTVRVTDARTLPGIGGTLFTGAEAFQDLGGGLAEATGIVNQSGDLVIGHGDQTLATWSLSMIPDAPPIIAVEGSPGPNMMRALEL